MEHESLVRLSVFLGVLLLMGVLEAAFPRKQLRFGRQRWWANLSLVLLNTLVARLVLPAGAIGAALWAMQHHWGLLPMLDMDDGVRVFLAVVLLDLVIYGQHVLFHRVSWLWRLHRVHHADRDIDVTTGLRFHPLEIVLSMLIKMGVVVLLGAPVLAVVIFEVVLNAMAMFNHANVRLPKQLNRVLSWLVMTPDIHRIHHSIRVAETNSNYGFNLCLWDRLFATFRAQPRDGHDGMTIGLPEYQQQPTHNIGWILRLPFQGKT